MQLINAIRASMGDSGKIHLKRRLLSKKGTVFQLEASLMRKYHVFFSIRCRCRSLCASFHIWNLCNIVGSTDRASSQQLQIWFSEHFFAPKLAA